MERRMNMSPTCLFVVSQPLIRLQLERRHFLVVFTLPKPTLCLVDSRFLFRLFVARRSHWRPRRGRCTREWINVYDSGSQSAEVGGS